MRLIIVCLCTLLSLASSLWAADVPTGGRQLFNFNHQWKVLVGDPADASSPAFADAEWKSVTTPHAWNQDEAFKADIRELPTGIAWYRKHFRAPAIPAGGKLFVEFEGVRQAGRFFLNGKELGLFENGINAFGFDLTPHLNPPGQDNVLAARIDSTYNYREQATGQTYQWNHTSFNASYGGINRNVWLHVTGPVHQTLPLFASLGTTGVYVYASDFNIQQKSAQLHVEAEVRNTGSTSGAVTCEVQVLTPSGNVVCKFASPVVTLAAGETKALLAEGPATNLDFWSWGHGSLYDVWTTLKIDGQVVDAVRTRTGFRKTEFKRGMLTLNDAPLHLKGYAQRTTNEWPSLGSAVPAWLSDFSNGLMVESNASLVRWMHTCPWKQDVESCDRVGLIQAMPAGDSEGDATGRRWEHRTAVMRDAIIYNRNNPSILFYEGGNKGISEAHMVEMKAIRDQYDPHGGRAVGARDMLAPTVAEYGGEMLYVNKSAGKPMWMMEYSRDEGLRKYWDSFSPPGHADAPAYNRNQDSHAIENVIRWFDYWEQRPGTGDRVNAGGANIIFSDTNTHHRGDENYRRSGEVDAMRIPKDGFFAHQVMWNGWVEVEQHGLHLMGHWNYTPEVTKNVVAVSSADRVELFINGVSRGDGVRSHHFLFTFRDVKWEPGTIKAVGRDAAGKVVAEDTLVTVSAPAAIKLTSRVSPDGLRADGHDVVLVDVEVVDSEGRRCPTAFHEITFDLQGAGEYRGGIAQGPGNMILSKVLPVECGINRVILRSSTSPGTLVLSASAAGLQPARVELTSQAVAVDQGLSKHFPKDHLPGQLKRGPAPSGRPLTLTRLPLKIAGAQAGSNSQNAARSFDDNENSNWSSDGTIPNSWIEYQLEKPAQISEIVMKTGQWRHQTYPVRISIDGAQVWDGELHRTLGFVTVTFPSKFGQKVRLDLTGPGVSGDGFGIIEITGARLGAPANQGQGRRGGRRGAGGAETPADPNAGTLSINEMEIFAPAPRQ